MKEGKKILAMVLEAKRAEQAVLAALSRAIIPDVHDPGVVELLRNAWQLTKEATVVAAKKARG